MVKIHEQSINDVVNNLNVLVVINKREAFLNDFRDFAVKTAKSTLEMCRVVYQAKQSLAKEEFLMFCNDIGHKSEDSTIRKYLVIGERYSDFIAHADLLPNSWTSIYKITQIPSETFDALVMSGYNMSSMNGKQIDALKAIDNNNLSVTTSNKKSQISVATTASTITSLNSNVNSDTYEVLIRFKTEPSNDDWWNLTEEIEQIISKHKLNVEVTDSWGQACL
jgi:hypothetical protein